MLDTAKKIAFIGQKGIPARWGGVERAAEELAVRAVRAGYHVTAYCRPWYTLMRPASYQGVHLVYLPSIHTKHLDTISHTFFSTLHALWNGADVIHFHGVGPALCAWIPRIISSRTRVIVTFHCIDRRLRKWNWVARFAFWCGEFVAMHAAHELFVTSRFLQDYCQQVWGRVALYLPNGVFDDASRVVSTQALEPFGVRPYEYIVCVGRLMMDKAQHELIEAFIRMKKRAIGDVQHLKLVIVGDASAHDPYGEVLHEFAVGRTDIVFTGTQTGSALKSLMVYARAGAQPSYSEGMPLSVLELAAHGVPLVLSDIPAHREIFGSTHQYVPCGDVDRMSRLLEHHSNNFEQMRPVAALQGARIQEQYRWEVIAARYHVALIDLLQRDPEKNYSGSIGWLASAPR